MHVFTNQSINHASFCKCTCMCHGTNQVPKIIPPSVVVVGPLSSACRPRMSCSVSAYMRTFSLGSRHFVLNRHRSNSNAHHSIYMTRRMRPYNVKSRDTVCVACKKILTSRSMTRSAGPRGVF